MPKRVLMVLLIPVVLAAVFWVRYAASPKSGVAAGNHDGFGENGARIEPTSPSTVPGSSSIGSTLRPGKKAVAAVRNSVAENARMKRVRVTPGLKAPEAPSSTDLAGRTSNGKRADEQKREADAMSVIRDKLLSRARTKSGGKVVEPTPRQLGLESKRLQVAQTYGALFEQLGLSDQEKARLENLLLFKPRFNGLDGNEVQPKVVPAAADDKPILSSDEVLENAILDLLGSDRYAAYKKYEATVPDRWVVEQYQTHLETLGKPMTKEQEEKLLEIVIEEQQDLPSLSAVNALADLPGVADKLAANLDKKAEVNAAILARAGAFLNAEQLQELKNIQERRMQNERRSLEVYRQLFQGGAARSVSAAE
ncbi:MAG: hypothetical protein GXP31_10905 [Kiritimatiellaeota bacterium]|nr:hypothetical protein [Kiritimatiellota bacterium]